jgi:SAM-dependent methyltransferase
MANFDMPSDLFRWCLTNTETGSEVFSYEICFPTYLAAAARDGYIWETYNRRLQELIEGVKTGMRLRVLEVGSGFGHDLLWTAIQGASAVGIDVNSDFVEISRRTKARVEAHTGRTLDADIRRTNLLAMDESEKFNLIYMKDVFHHLEPREDVVAKLGALLAPGGQVIVVEPNALNPLIQWQMYRIRGFRTVIEKVDIATGERFLFGNERLVTGGGMCRVFARNGVRGSVRRMRLLPTRLAVTPWMVRLARGLEHLGFERMAAPACIHTIFVGRKGP